jgi:hypothetical protein
MTGYEILALLCFIGVVITFLVTACCMLSSQCSRREEKRHGRME